jgi:NTE family protein
MAAEKALDKTVALALSGGGVRAAAHLGIVEVLRQEGFSFEVISGSSGGALAAVLLSDGYAPREVLEIYREINRFDLVRHFRRGGMFSLDAIETHLGKYLSVDRIEALATKCIIASTDLTEGRIHYFDKGPAAKLAVASSSLIPFFAPVTYENYKLCDGGFMDNMPTKPLAGRGLPVLGINVNPILPQTTKNVMQTSYRVLILMMAANIEASKAFADIYLEVEGCADINILDISQLDAAYDAGVAEAEKALEKGLLDLAQQRIEPARWKETLE